MTIGERTPLINGQSYFSDDYYFARHAFLNAVSLNSNVRLKESIPLQARGFLGEKLTIDIAWLGNLEAKKILIHIGGTHGVEGFAGSAIARSLLEDPPKLDEDTAILFVHALNPYGMALNRRVSENNIDLNRNFSEERQSPPLYAKINNLVNPQSHAWIDFFHLRLLASILWNGWSSIKEAVASGQYDFPEGLFYGGTEIEEGPGKLLEWFEVKFSQHPFREELRIGIIDVHTGLGPKGYDTILAIDDNLKPFFGDRIGGDIQDKQVGYHPRGMFVEALKHTLAKVTECASERITALGQEFGTYSVYWVLKALRNENSAFHDAKRQGGVLVPSCSESQALLRVFYPGPEEKEWRVDVINRGRSLVQEVASLLSKLGTTT
jgi:Protein of unknown function (DUF2817)